ncbi:MAG: hypothetical protein HKN91_04820 [Acidimicrobiia bacterium]|nr:hypothetical protein [Acidimicrobiia bacterium]
MSQEDPKPGRWLLPLVVAGLIGFTFVFVNALPEAETVSANPTTTTDASATTTTEAPSTTTPTTLAPAVVDFLESADVLDRNVADLASLAQQINEDWDNRDEEFGPTRDALEDLEAQTVTLVNETSELAVPPALSEWDDVSLGLAALRQAAADMIDGLVNAEGSEPRIAALAAYRAAADDINAAITRVKEAVVDPTA